MRCSRSSPTAAAARSADIHIALIHQLPLLRRIRPDARKTIRLQFQPHRKRIPFAGLALLQAPHFRLRSQNLLHMMADLMRNHICLRELSRRSEPILQLPKKSQIQINLLIPRTIKRAHRRLRPPAR